MRRNLLTFKDIIERTGISRAALQSYKARGLLPSPIAFTAEADGAARQVGQFDPSVLETIARIQALAASGVSLDEIGMRLAANDPGQPARLSSVHLANNNSRAVLQLTLEQGPHMAYLLNHRFEVQWLNEAARARMPGLTRPLPPDAAGRSLFKLLLDTDAKPDPDHIAVLRLNLALAKAMTPFAGLPQTLSLPADRLQLLRKYLEEATSPARAPASAPGGVMRLSLRLNGSDAPGDYVVHATRFREGVLVIASPEGDSDSADELRRLLARRDLVLHALINRRLPVLTKVAAIAARLQDSSKVCSELPPGEYFALITQLWSMAETIIRAHSGSCTRGSSDTLVGYFFDQPENDRNGDYRLNALRCALALKTAMATLSKDWQLRKNWPDELCLNIGLNEAEEWLGARHGPAGEEILVLGDLVSHASHLSEIARFGQVWAAKNFISKLPAAARERLEFGIERVTADGQRVLVRTSYATVDTLFGSDTKRLTALREIAGIELTEIRGLRE